MAKRTNLLHQRDECNQGIRDLGVLPQEAYEKYKNADATKVLNILMHPLICSS
jgi:structural maintenance of chromosome 3 (chondroitin sulfate proteoglycan 6)